MFHKAMSHQARNQAVEAIIDQLTDILCVCEQLANDLTLQNLK